MTHGSTKTTDRELVIVRTFDAPIDLVFRAWTEPSLVLQWMRPNGFTVISATLDARVGGMWSVQMRSPEGADMWHSGMYQEVVAPRRLVFTHIWSGAHPEPDHETLVTIDFVEREGRTEMTFRQGLFQTRESSADHTGGWSQAFEALGRVVSDH